MPDDLPGLAVAADGSVEEGYTLTWHVQHLRRRAQPVLARSSSAPSSTPASRPSLALLIGYPLAYAIAFKSGRWKNVLLVLVIAPFFTSFLIRTLAWQTILADDGDRRLLRSTTLHIPRCCSSLQLITNDRCSHSPFAVITA